MNAPDLGRACVAQGGSLEDAARALEHGGSGIALVIDEAGRLVGTLTDGDLRRALLAGATLGSPLLPHVSRQFTAVPPSAGRAHVLDLMRARSLGQIPVVDSEGRVAGLHLLRELVGRAERPNWAVLMAGGLGTRLLPLTERVPKPMLRVAGRPILERLVLHLVGFGVRRIYLAINHLGDVIERHFGDGAQLGARIEYLRETEPLGTGGALALLAERPDRPLLVMNGDLVSQADLGAMLDFHERLRPRLTVGVRPYTHTVPFGRIVVEQGRVVDYREKPQLVLSVNAGIYVVDPDLLPRIGRGQAFPLPGLVEGCLERGEPVAAFEIEDDWLDVGEADSLRRAREGL